LEGNFNSARIADILHSQKCYTVTTSFSINMPVLSKAIVDWGTNSKIRILKSAGTLPLQLLQDLKTWGGGKERINKESLHLLDANE
jgi:hypothetical protein